MSTQKLCPQCGGKFDKGLMVCSSDGTLLLLDNPTECRSVPTSFVGERIGHYEVISIRNMGDKSYILEVKHNSGKHLAMKMLRPELSQNKSSFERFQQEARVACAMAHPNVVEVIDFGLSPWGQPYLVMELLEGVTLGAVITANGPLQVEAFRNIFKQVSNVLGSAHKRGIVHRDIKPEHVMLVEDGDSRWAVKLLDFGCSKDLEREQKLTVAGLVIGNADYMSPEQCSAGAIDARSDVYSLGCIMYYALTGRKPFEGSIVSVMQKHISDVPPGFKLENMDADTAKEVEQIIFKAMAKEPNQRQQNVDELWQEMESALSNEECTIAKVSKKEKLSKQNFLEGLTKHFKKSG